MEMILIGISHRTAGIEVRERVTFSVEQARQAAGELLSRKILREAVILSTCNRSELYGVPCEPATDGMAATESFLASFHHLKLEELRAVFYRHHGLDVARHVYRVAAGLDSMFLGEAEILGQVREAYRVAAEHGTTGRVLNRLFQDALALGKRARAETQIGALPMSVAFAGVKLAERIFNGDAHRRVLVIGAGATSEQVMRHFRDRGLPEIRIVNRTLENARILTGQFGGEVIPWENLPAALEWPDLVVTSVSAPEPVLSRELLERTMEARRNRTLMVIDLGVPRNVAPAVGGIDDVHLYDIDDLTEIVLQNRRARAREVPRAEAIIEEHIENFRRWHAWGNCRSEGRIVARERGRKIELTSAAPAQGAA
jgi:glutamyl-tRNA reductase